MSGDIRLVDGANEYEGRLEICYKGVWGTIVDYNWNIFETRLACSQLGYNPFGISFI